MDDQKQPGILTQLREAHRVEYSIENARKILSVIEVSDTQELFFHPEKYNFTSFPNVWDGSSKPTSMFKPASVNVDILGNTIDPGIKQLLELQKSAEKSIHQHLGIPLDRM